jgi:uncharacterized protein with ParB-like and HNH nuclease domain
MSESTTVKSLITPLDQTLRQVFNTQKSYFIDIYQREYKWTKEQVETLLNDVGDRFAQHKRPKIQPKDIQEDVFSNYDPYFLNTYLTSKSASNTAIVDGQQRLTTLLLILIKLYHVLKTIEQDPTNHGKTFSSKVVEQLIFETDDFGAAGRFKIFNENRESAFKALVEGVQVKKADQSCTRMAENFQIISAYFDTFLAESPQGPVDLVKTTYYLTYLLDRISIVEIRIERQDNVAMIFEVVNDRGLGLKPYEILKGKLIGGLPTKDKEEANKVWTKLQEDYFKVELKNTTEKAIDLDYFFQTYFRSKFADSENDYEKFSGAYHYEMYRNPRVRALFGEFKDTGLLFRRIIGEIRFFAQLYLELRTSYKYESLIFNKLLDQNQQYLLIMSAISMDDPERDRKIDAVACKFDQFHTVIRLLDAYDSNAFQRLVYRLNKDIRDKNLEEVKACFDSALLNALEEAEILQPGQHTDVLSIFEFERFKNVRNQWTNFSKYVLMRIDRYLAALLDKPSYAMELLDDLEDRFNKNNLRRYGMHLEHIITQHPKNHALFVTDNLLDEARFAMTRNLLGMVLLLKDKQNLSSNNEIYQDKQATYSQSNLIWNELLVGHIPSSDLNKLPETLKVPVVAPENGVFPLAAVEDRQRTMFEAIKTIWAAV